MADRERESPKLELQIDGIPPASLSFLSFRAQEQLSECYRIDAQALCPRLHPDALLGRKAAVFVRFEGHPERAFHGVIWSATLTPVDERVCRLEVQIVPRLLQLSLGRDSRSATSAGPFHEISLLEVIKRVLAAGGIGVPEEDIHVSDGPTHDAVTQLGESDYDFLRRLLFEEGIAFAIQNDAEEERVILFEDASASLAVDGLDTLVDRRRSDLRFDTVVDLQERYAGTPDGVMLRDYDFKNPSRSPDAHAPNPPAPSREVYQHPGGNLELDMRAQRTLERLNERGRQLEGTSFWPHLEPGRHVKLESELRAGLGCELLITGVEHEGHVHDPKVGAAYRNRFVAIPKGTPFRPEHAPCAPHTYGTQRAFVSGPTGQELHGDALGRIKVRFPWDRSGTMDDRSSAFVRVGQPQLSGSMIIPRVGFEVLVGDELGDLDRPYVTGHLYNEEAPLPYGADKSTTSSLQSATTESGAGANELRFGDSAGAEEMLMNASFDLSLRVENAMTWTVGKNETQEIGADATLSVKDACQVNVGGNRKQHVGAMQTVDIGGNHDEGVGGNQSLTIGAARNATIGGDQIENVAGTLTRTVSALQNVVVIDGFTRKVVGSSQTKVGAAWAETVVKSTSSTVSGSRIENVAALKLISAKNVGISAGAAYAEKVASQEITTSKDRSDTAGDKLSVQVAGEATIEAENITFTAEDQLTFVAGDVSFTLKKTGEIRIKADKITIENSKAFKQLTHKTN